MLVYTILSHISTGDLLREERSKNTELGTKIHEYLSAQKFIPDDIIFSLLSQALAKHENSKIIFDGVPRTVTQAIKVIILVYC